MADTASPVYITIPEQKFLKRTYSPTQTTTYAVCPVKWWLAYKAGPDEKGLVPAKVSSMQAYDRLAGDAGHRMLATWYLTGDMGAGVTAAHEAIDMGLESLVRSVTMYEPPSAGELKAEIDRLSKAYVLRYPREAWKVVGVELALTQPAACKLDLLVIDADGEPAIVEHKFPGPKARLEQQAGRWRMSYQPYNYCWAADEAKQVFGLTKPCRRIIMNFVQRAGKLDPTKHLVRYPIEVKEHLLGIHKQQASRLWAQMSQAESFHAATAQSESSAQAAIKERVSEAVSVQEVHGNAVRIPLIHGTQETGTGPRQHVWPNWEACDTRWGRCEFIPLCESGWEPAVEEREYRSKGTSQAKVGQT